MHIVQQPALLDAPEVEMDLRGIAQIPEFGDYRPPVFARVSARDTQIRDGPILAIHPEVEIQAANFALRSFPVVLDEFAQPGSKDILRRPVGAMA